MSELARTYWLHTVLLLAYHRTKYLFPPICLARFLSLFNLPILLSFEQSLGSTQVPMSFTKGKETFTLYTITFFYQIRIKTDGIGPQGASAQILIFDPALSLSSFSSIHWYVRDNPYHWDVSGQRSFEVLYLCYCSFKLAFLSNRIDSPLQINHITRMSLTNH